MNNRITTHRPRAASRQTHLLQRGRARAASHRPEAQSTSSSPPLRPARARLTERGLRAARPAPPPSRCPRQARHWPLLMHCPSGPGDTQTSLIASVCRVRRYAPISPGSAHGKGSLLLLNEHLVAGHL
ncbi:hypothetical protein PHLGIDRAFT_344155 [Phlebiopsis gigantea 11061_1 CR5-6]|uniref:Uncharacterized protein n=1 Tax=Phlebiopsis gigantea (strain 11061_1 CR5-6) TaxID=745531 RepID=A0A0C3SAI2_PHLG1|nr:hypothetical protein PHLGIDRAFT_344155 [Phlebiopsis gigantea 11061_1 CR5-6]